MKGGGARPERERDSPPVDTVINPGSLASFLERNSRYWRCVLSGPPPPAAALALRRYSLASRLRQRRRPCRRRPQRGGAGGAGGALRVRHYRRSGRGGGGGSETDGDLRPGKVASGKLLCARVRVTPPSPCVCVCVARRACVLSSGRVPEIGSPICAPPRVMTAAIVLAAKICRDSARASRSCCDRSSAARAAARTPARPISGDLG